MESNSIIQNNISMDKVSQVKLYNEYIVNMNVVLGKGSTGSVYEGRDIKNNNKVAVKVIDLSSIDNEVMEYLLCMEKTALMSLDSSSILKGLRVMQDEKFCFMVTEYCNGGTLKKHIQAKGLLSEEKSMEIMKQIIEGYQNLVSQGIIHRDLKPANIMLHNEKPKIIDFGYCEIAGFKKPDLEYNVGSPSYMAPESFESNIYNEKTEIWALGVILYECLTGKPIDEGEKMTYVYKKIKQSGVPYPEFISQHAKNIINWCLDLNPENRPTCSELLNKYFRPRVDLARERSCSNIEAKVNFFKKNKENNLSLNASKFLESSKKLSKVETPIEPSSTRKPSHSYSITPSSSNFAPLQMQENLLPENRSKPIENILKPSEKYNGAWAQKYSYSNIKAKNIDLKENKPTKIFSLYTPSHKESFSKAPQIPQALLTPQASQPHHSHTPSAIFNPLINFSSKPQQNQRTPHQKNMSQFNHSYAYSQQIRAVPTTFSTVRDAKDNYLNQSVNFKGYDQGRSPVFAERKAISFRV